MAESTDPCWWLSSGGIVSLDGSIARTIQGALPADAPWRARYAESNPVDTEQGRHPQNLLRLVTRHQWEDYRQEVRFRVMRVNLSASTERDSWSGVFLFLRYQDANNLYYAGVRMDGTAVIKKKLRGEYFTLGQEPVFGQPEAYDRAKNPSLLPREQWIGMAATIADEGQGGVRIALRVREGVSGEWRTAVTALDAGANGPPIRGPGHAGLRGDFADLEFSGYSVTPAGR